MIPSLSVSLPEASILLISLALKGAVLLGVASLLALLMSRASAASRHAVWSIAFTMLLALPVLLASVPAWQVPVLGLASGETIADPAPLASLPPPAPLPPLPGMSQIGEAAAVPALPQPPRLPDEPSAAAMAPAGWSGLGLHGDLPVDAIRAAAGTLWTRIGSAIPAPLGSVGAWILVFWLLGGVFVASRWIVAFTSARRLVSRAEKVTDETWQALNARICRTLGLDVPVELYRSDRLAVPVAWCFGSPAVILPGEADDWSAERREVVLMHEVAHVVRRDGATQIVAQAAVVLHWFNPLAWFAYGQLLLEREHACDDIVLAHGTRASIYAEHLLDIASRFRQESLALLAVAPMARRSNLEGRLHAILNPSLCRKDARPSVVGGIATGAILLALPLAAFQPVHDNGTMAERPGVEAPLAPAGSVATVAGEWTWNGAVSDGGFVEVHSLNGAINVKRGSGRAVSVVGTPNRLSEGDARLVVNELRDGVVICVVYRGQSGCEPGSGTSGRARDRNRGSLNLEITMPERSPLVARAVNGSITSETLAAAIDARTTNGSVNVASRSGDVVARTTNGAVDLTASGRITAQTTNGSIRARLADTGWQGPSRLATTNGSIEVVLPSQPNVDVDARSRNGRITSDLPIDVVRTRSSGATASGRIGNGGRNLELRTTNGRIRLLGADGQTIGADASRAYDADGIHAPRDLVIVERRVAAATEAALAAEMGLQAAGLAASVAETTLEALLDGETVDAILESVARSLDAANVHIETAHLQREIDAASIREKIRDALEEVRMELEQARGEMRR
jgi:beta-lactamase regulating signal transducer with metallopeptidase domain